MPFIGTSQALKRTLAQIEAVAATPASVLVLGESGVGKEMVARAIHARGDRADKSLVKVNCASIPKDLFESEFFGHIKGAFTGAHRDRIGRLQLADGGTVFLDEVGEIPLSLQGKLQRHRWPGNIRELKNVIERAVILGRGSRARIDLAMPGEIPDPARAASVAAADTGFVSDAGIRELERENMLAALRHANWRIWGAGGAAEMLGLKPSTLTYRMKVFGIRKDV